MWEKRPRLLVIWGKYELSFDLREPERYRQDVPNAEDHVLDAGHFALDTAADEMAAWVGNFMAVSRSELRARRAG
jgi:pimeloyl-ACP methyl ester carboxylesterase